MVLDNGLEDLYIMLVILFQNEKARKNLKFILLVCNRHCIWKCVPELAYPHGYVIKSATTILDCFFHQIVKALWDLGPTPWSVGLFRGFSSVVLLQFLFFFYNSMQLSAVMVLHHCMKKHIFRRCICGNNISGIDTFTESMYCWSLHHDSVNSKSCQKLRPKAVQDCCSKVVRFCYEEKLRRHAWGQTVLQDAGIGWSCWDFFYYGFGLWQNSF